MSLTNQPIYVVIIYSIFDKNPDMKAGNTDFKEEEDVLAKEDLSVLLDGLDEGIVLIDGRGRVFFMNDSAISIASGDFSGRSYREIFSEWTSASGSKQGTMYEVPPFMFSPGGRLVSIRCDKRPDDYYRLLLTSEDHTCKDALTGVFNRRFLQTEVEWLEALRNRQRKHKDPRDPVFEVGIVFGDIDGLKKANDVEGYAAGDALIREIADVFKKTLRESDLVFRYGGDEFVLLLPNQTKGETEIVLQRLQTAAEGLPLSLGVFFVGKEMFINEGIQRAAEEMKKTKAARKSVL